MSYSTINQMLMCDRLTKIANAICSKNARCIGCPLNDMDSGDCFKKKLENCEDAQLRDEIMDRIIKRLHEQAIYNQH